MIEIHVGEWTTPSQWNQQSWLPTLLLSVPKVGEALWWFKKTYVDQHTLKNYLP